MSNIFQTVKFNKPKKNKFDLSHERKMSMKMGTLTPFLFQEVLPGDSFRVNTEMLMRMQPMLAPIYHRVRVKTDYYFVPNRLVWDNWQKFITGGDKGTDTPLHPYLNVEDTSKAFFAKGSLADYLGVPALDQTASIPGVTKINALPFRAYQLIYNEFYRDQNLIDEIPIYKGDGYLNGADLVEMTTMRRRAWEKDYYTSCLPWAQKGGAVQLPIELQGYAPVVVNPLGTGTTQARINGTEEPGSITVAYSAELDEQAGRQGDLMTNLNDVDATNITVNDLRISVRLQEWLERQARAGSRYIETILSNWGVLSSDARLQRPEYLGGSINPIVISEVLSTYQNSDDSGYPQGNMSGHGISTGGNGGFKRRFEEHGFVFGIMTVIPRTAYQQGIEKKFTRFDKFDYAWPSFANLGEQAVKNQELYFDPYDTVGENIGTFGYQSRYAEYKYQQTTVHGDFREELDYWHLGRKFANRPQLNQAFIEANPDKRIFAVTEEDTDEILCQIYNRVDAMRCLPYYNTPTL